MTPENNEQTQNDTLESQLDRINVVVGEMDKTLRHVYETTKSISDQAERIYDAIAYNHDIPTYDVDHDFLDMLDE